MPKFRNQDYLHQKQSTKGQKNQTTTTRRVLNLQPSCHTLTLAIILPWYHKRSTCGGGVTLFYELNSNAHWMFYTLPFINVNTPTILSSQLWKLIAEQTFNDLIHNVFVYESHFSTFFWKCFFTILTTAVKYLFLILRNLI